MVRLKDDDLKELALRLTNMIDLYHVAFRLGVRDYQIKKYNNVDVTRTALEVLRHWKRTLPREEQKHARRILARALVACGFVSFAYEGLGVTEQELKQLKTEVKLDEAKPASRHLTDLQMFAVAGFISDEVMYRTMGGVLGIREYTLDRFYKMYHGLMEATLEMLLDWRQGFTSSKKARWELGRALVRGHDCREGFGFLRIAVEPLQFTVDELERIRNKEPDSDDDDTEEDENEDEEETELENNTTLNFPHTKLMAAYREALKTGEVPSHRGRINIIGHSGAGKTSLTRNLLGKNCPENLDSTEGIDTHRIELHLDENGEWEGIEWPPKELKTKNIEKQFYQVAAVTGKLSTQVTDLDEKDSSCQEEKETECSEDVTHPEENTNEKEQKVASPGEAVPSTSQENGATDDPVRTAAEQDATSAEPPADADLMELRKVLASGLPTQEKKGIVRLWDFGGQTEFYTTHHLFLDADAVNIIVMDVSKGLKEDITEIHDDLSEESEESSEDDSEEDATENQVRNEEAEKKGSGQDLTVGIPKTQEEFLCYWLRTIQSSAAEKHVPEQVILVLTHEDQINKRDPSQHIEDFKTKVRQVVHDKNLPKISKKYMHTVDNIGGTTESKETFIRIRDQLFKMLKKQKSRLDLTENLWGMKRPARWLKLEAEINKKLNQVDYLKKEEVEELARVSTNGLMDAEELQTFLEIYHSIGELFYSAHAQVIVNPQWLVNVFKKIIAPPEFIKKRQEDIAKVLLRGEVNEEIMRKIWKVKKKEVAFIANLLMTFDLLVPLFKLGKKEKFRRFVVPCILPDRRKEMDRKNLPLQNTHNVVYSCDHKLSRRGDVFLIGTFAKLFVRCSKIWNLRDEGMCSKHVTFQIENTGLLLALTESRGSIISVSIWCQAEELEENPLKVLLETRQTLDLELGECGVPLCEEFDVICPFWKPQEVFDLVKVHEVGVDKLRPGTRECLIHKRPLSANSFKSNGPDVGDREARSHQSRSDAHVLSLSADRLSEVFYLELAKQVSVDWENVGTNLGISRNYMARLRRDYPGQTLEQIQELFQKWLRLGSKTVQELYNALSHSGLGQCATLVLEEAKRVA